jgi:hypothetical protein
MAKLPHVRIVAINNDLVTYVKNAKKTTIDGASLDYIYSIRNGVKDHGFDDSTLYQIFIREGNYALVTEALVA